MMKVKFEHFFCLFSLALVAVSCQQDSPGLEVSVENPLDFDRKEVVAVETNKLADLLEGSSEENIRVKKKGSEDYLRTQWIDYDQDGTSDELLFQAEVGANATVVYELVIDGTKAAPESDAVAYSRFVPERTDDYAWENDKVAFRTYGPTGQREALEGVPGSTLSSGIDLWLKRTDRPVINKWYAEHQKEPGYYHIDHGEGYDPYHVGASRGTGGVGVWENDSLYVSQNFTEHQTIADGPLRTVFDLTYAPWSPYAVSETKRITLDLGSNFSKIELSLAADEKLPNIALGITLHNNEGEVEINKEAGWVRYWEVVDGSNVGEGIVIDPALIDTAFARQTDIPDQSNLLVLAEPKDKVTYYAGFAWEKSGQVASADDWDAILEQQSKALADPLKVTVK